jgi:hypothetical protein
MRLKRGAVFDRDGWIYEEKMDGWRRCRCDHEAIFAVGGIGDADAFDGVLVGEHAGDRLEFRRRRRSRPRQ